ncbi:hypothetical protein OESDEN_10324 [Oesophagostomum dentatum]|uniref:Uncharacterized protein n=1 Tax=Oesophagostomum dentatum TaxID=61180 RepID=A0A0B1T117_OESDE|nr:hypothetical protein OESDEN_10324 [Oesophagostomum dentatum]
MENKVSEDNACKADGNDSHSCSGPSSSNLDEMFADRYSESNESYAKICEGFEPVICLYPFHSRARRNFDKWVPILASLKCFSAFCAILLLSAVVIGAEAVTEDGTADVETGEVKEGEAVTITGRITIAEDNGGLGMIGLIMAQTEETGSTAAIESDQNRYAGCSPFSVVSVV